MYVIITTTIFHFVLFIITYLSLDQVLVKSIKMKLYLKMGTTSLLLVSIAFLIEDGSTANILGVVPYFITSHFSVMQPIFLELANRGHNVTVISSKTDKHLPQNYRHIEVDQIGPKEMFLSKHNIFDIYGESKPMLMEIFFTFDMFTNYAIKLMQSKKLQEFILHDESQFDVVICEDFRFAPFYMFAHKYKAPLITMTTFGAAHWVEDYMANPMNLQYVPHEFLPYPGTMSLIQRLKNVVFTFTDLLMKRLYFDSLQNKLIDNFFGHLPKPLPSVQELERNTSLVLLNTHFSMDTVRSQLPNIVEVGGIHIKSPKKLPADLQKILDNSKDGVIYFSMGSNIASKDLPHDKRDAFLKVFSELKQTILWKWEDDILPGQPKNVIIRKWFPQSDILAHPNIRLFITHGGLLSNQEAVFRGVPVVGIPIFGDQPSNVAKAKAIGYAEDLPFATLSEETIRTALTKVLTNPSYHKKAKEISAKINDKPATSLETAIYWVEYVIRHNGAYHMKPASIHMPWYEYYLLDVGLILILSVSMVLYVPYKVLSFLFQLIFKKREKKENVPKSKKRN